MVNARWLVVLSILVMCQACSLSGHRVVQSTLGTASSLAEKPMNLKSLLLLKDLVSRHPTMDVRFGHQR